MTLRAHLLDAAVDGAPGESVEIQLAVLNDAEGPQTITATVIGVGGDLDDQPLAAPASITVAAMSRTRLSVPVVVPSSYGVGRHAIGIRVTGVVPTDTVLLTATISIASVRDVDLDPTPSPVRGRRRVSTQLDITNREPHPVDVRLGTDQSPANPVRVKFKPDAFSLPPGGHAIAKVKLRGPRHWVGDRLQHNVRLTAVGRASQTGVNLPYVQKPLVAAKLRGLVAVVVVLALWLSLVVVGAWFINDRFLNDDGGSTATEADADGTDGNGSGGDGSGGDGSSGDGSSDGSGDAGADGSAGDGTGDGSGADDGGPAADGTGDDAGDGSGGDGTGGDGGADDGSGDGSGDDGSDESAPPVDDSIPDTESSTPAVVVRGTIDVEGAETAGGVTIYPSKMLLADVADTTTAFATAAGVTDPQPRKIWSARYAPPSEPPRLAQTEPIDAGPFAPNAQGIWATELSANQAYELAFVRPGYQTQSFVVTPQVGSEIELDVTLEPAKGVIGGQVSAGGPRQNVAITVTDGFVDYQTATDQSGRWIIEGVPTDELYTVLASIEGFGAAARQDRVEPENPERLDLDLTLFQGRGVVTGSVIDAVLATQPGQEAGLGGVSVTAVDGDDERSTTTLTTGSIGDFVLPDLAVGRRYTLQAELDGYAPATTQVTVTGAVTGSPTLSLMPLAATLTGVVTSESGGGAPVPLATIKVTSDSSPEPIAFVQSSSDTGEFTLGQVPPGRYQIVVDHFGHAIERLDLVVQDSTTATLTPSMPGAPTQTGTRFSITMTPQDSTSVTLPTGSLALEIRDADENAECPRQPDGTLRPAVQCLAVFDATVHIRTTDPALIPKSEDDPSPFQKVVDATGREHWEFVCASPAGVCDSGTNFPDYTIRGIPAGTYTVVTSNPEYNSTVRQVTVFPNQVNRETIPMVRLGTVRGTVVDSTNPDQSILGGNTVIVKVVSIDQNGNDLDEFRTAVIDGGFQTDDEVRLPVGRYRIDVQAQAAGYYIDDDRQDVDDNVNTVDGLEFEILPFIPGNPVTSLIELQPILADPYPELQVRTFQPATADPPTFETIGVDPIARVTCATNSIDNTPITVSSADAGGLTGLPAGTVGLSKVQVAQLDGAEVVGRPRDIGHGDGLLRDCSLTVEATGFEPLTYPFSGLTVLADDRDPLELTVDRYLDVAMLREPPAGTVRVPSGSLWWIDEGAGGNQEVPIPGAQITSASVIAQLVPSDSTAEPVSGTAAGVDLWQPTLSTTSVTSGTRATWDFAPVIDPNGAAITVEHVIGDAVFAVDGPDGSLGEQFPGGTITLSTDIAGGQTLTVQTDPDITNDPNIADGRYDTELDPSGGTIQGRVQILTADPTPLSYVDNFELTATMAARTHVVAPVADGTFDIPVHPGTWNVAMTMIDGHIFSDPLSGQTNPFVPPAEDAPTLFRVVEYGGFTLTVNSTEANVPNTPIDYTLTDESTGTDYAVPTNRIDELPVPTVFPANSTQKKYYVLTIDSAGGLDPRNASVAIYRQFNDGRPDQLLTTYSGVNLTNGFRYPEGWQGGDDYEFRITLQPYGRVEGYISGFEGPGATPALVCPNVLPADNTPVTLTAVPVTLVTTDPLLPPVPVLDTTSGRENIVTTACDGPPNKWAIGGRAGYYVLLATHPDFNSSHDEFSDPNPIVINVPLTPGVTDHNIANVNPVPRLELRQTQLDISVTSDTPNPVGTPYYVLTRNGNPVSGPAVVDGTVEVSATPGDDYRIEVRACTAAQIPVTDFEGCDARFPAIMPFSVPRSPSAAVDVVLPLLTVGSQIDMTILFENAAGDPACPADPSVTVGRRFTGTLAPGTVGGTAFDQDDTDLEDERTESRNNSANPVCGGTDGNEVSLTFAELIPGGPSQFTLPTITGYSNEPPEVIIDGGSPEKRYDPTVDVTTTSHSIDVTYVADNIDVTLNLCTGTSAVNRDCTNEFHGLTADLDGITGSVGPRGPNGTPVTFTDVGPANNPRTLTITDLTHDNSVTPSVQVGSNQPSTQTVDFPGIKAVVAADLTPDPNDAVVSVVPSADVTALSPCNLVDQGTVTSYARCFLIDTPGGADFDVDVTFPNTTIPDYLAASVDIDDVDGGQTRIVPISLVQRATLSVAVQARDESFNLDTGVDAVSDVTPHITLGSPGAASAPDTDLVLGTSDCTNGFCTLTYRVDPNVNYQFTVAGNAYEFDSTSIVLMTPGQQRNLGGQEGLELRPRVVTVPVDPNGLDVSEVELDFGPDTFTSTTSTTSNGIETFRFSTLDAQPIPLSGNPGRVFVRVADGRNRAVTNPTINGDVVQQVEVFDYASASGTFTAAVTGPVTVEATSGATTLTTTVSNSDIANGWTITGLDVDDDGSNRTWTFNVVGAAAGPTQSVDATTASYTITTPLGPAPRVIEVPVDTSGLGTGDSVTSATLTIGGTTYTSSDTTVDGNTTTVQFRSDSGVGAIPLTGTPTVALITVDGGRNRRDASLNFSTSGNDPDDGDNPTSGTVYRGGSNPIQVNDYATGSGSFSNDVVGPVTVDATSGGTTLSVTVQDADIDDDWIIVGLDNNADGSDRTWTFNVRGSSDTSTTTVNATTGSYSNIGGNGGLDPAPRTIDVPITTNGLDVSEVEIRIDGSNYDSSNYTTVGGTRTFHFSTESSLPNSDTIPFEDNPTRITVTVDDGRNRRDSSPTFTATTGANNPNSGTTNTIAVSGYATVSGTVDSGLTGPVTVEAKSGGTTLTSSAIADPSAANTWSISGLFNDDDGSDRTWTIKIVGADGNDEEEIDVDATTANYTITDPLVDTS